MILNVGTKNITKLKAVEDAVVLYPEIFPYPQVVALEVHVEEFGHPKNLEEVVSGAMDRAKKAFVSCSFSFGLEGGLMAVPHTRSGYMETNACAIFDGKEIYLGLGPCFEWPKKMTDLIINESLDGSQAFKKLGWTTEKKIGNVPGGIIGVLSNGKYTREDFVKHSIAMAVIRLQTKQYYE